MVLLTGTLAIPVLPPLVSVDEVTSIVPSESRYNPAVFVPDDLQNSGTMGSRDRTMILGQTEAAYHEALARCDGQSMRRAGCVSVEDVALGGKR